MSEATKSQMMEEKAEIKAAQKENAEIKAAQEEKPAKGKKEKTKDVKNERIAPPEYGPDVVIHIPEDKLNPGLNEIPVHINEYSWIIKRGEKQVVPEAVLDVLQNAGYL